MEILDAGGGRKISQGSLAAARECLPALRALVASQASEAQLLRASSAATAVETGELLRASAETVNSRSSAELLRPGK